MKRNSKFSAFLIIIGILLICAVIFGICLHFLMQKDKKQPSSGEFYPANYNENIFLNHAYMSFQRDMLYSIGGVEQLFSYEKDLETAEPECQFFLKYFQTVIHGDYDSYENFFVDGYFTEDPKFTMQMLYEPRVQFHSVSTDEVNGEQITLKNFEVGYRIFKNNKTFRDDVSSNVEVPQIYQLIQEKDGTYRIFRILNIEVEE